MSEYPVFSKMLRTFRGEEIKVEITYNGVSYGINYVRSEDEDGFPDEPPGAGLEEGNSPRFASIEDAVEYVDASHALILAEEDLDAFNAPSECYAIALKGRLYRRFQAIEDKILPSV